MNEQIRLLAEQAGLKKEHGSDREYTGDFDWREFAQLIVEECIQQVKDQYVPVLEDKDMMSGTHWDGYVQCHWDGYVQCGVDSVVGIREHFYGVEE